jgi:hypothetical protein
VCFGGKIYLFERVRGKEETGQEMNVGFQLAFTLVGVFVELHSFLVVANP